MEKNFYERCIYESVNDGSLYGNLSQKSTENKIHFNKGLMNVNKMKV